MNKLKTLRKEKGLSQQALGKAIGVSYRTVQNWENGVNQIKPDKAQILADYFGVPVGYLLGYSDNNELRNALAHDLGPFTLDEFFENGVTPERDLLDKLNSELSSKRIKDMKKDPQILILEKLEELNHKIDLLLSKISQSDSTDRKA